MAETWFDTRTGELLVGSAAIEQRLPESSPGDVVPLQELLPLAPADLKGLYAPLDASHWTKSDSLNLGRWLVNMQRSVNRDTFWCAQALGLAPALGKMVTLAEVSSFAMYKRSIGLEHTYQRGLYDDWSKKDFVNYAQAIHRQVDRKLKETDFKNAEGPSLWTIRSRFGSIGVLNEALGYPDISKWDKDDYIDWGVRILQANDGEFLTFSQVEAFSKAGKGPCNQSIYSRFPEGRSAFRDLITQEYETRQTQRAKVRAIKLERYRGMIDSGQLPAQFKILPEDELLHFGAKHELIAHILRKHPGKDTLAVQLAPEKPYRILKKLRTITDIDAVTFELEAEALGIFDDVWPMPELDEALKVA